MKVMCKSSWEWNKNIIFEKDKLYEFDKSSNVITYKGDAWYIPNNHFYTPEETINILRTNLINKML